MIHYIESSQLTDEILKNNNLIIVEFCIPNSEPCEMQHKVLVELEKEFCNDITVFKIDFAESQFSKIRYDVSSVPTVLFFKDKKELERKVGFTTKEEIVRIMQELI